MRASPMVRFVTMEGPIADPSRQRWTLIAALASYSIFVWGFAYAAYIANDRHLVYALDDAYIHMAMAANMAEHGVVGLTPYDFSASSSSPLWTSSLALLYFIFGKSEWLPFLLNYLGGVGALLVIWRFGRDAGLVNLRLGTLLGAIMLTVPMVPLTFTGMEHVLHLVVVLLVMYSLWCLLRHGGRHPVRAFLPLGVLSAVAVAVRYESLFLVVAVAVVLAAKRQGAGIAVVVTGALVSLFGVGFYLVAHGQQFLPNGVLLKGHFPDLKHLEGVAMLLRAEGLLTLVKKSHLFSLTVFLIFLLRRDWVSGRRSDERNLLVVAVLITTVLHLLFARTGWFFRYEGYLVGMAWMALFIHVGNAPVFWRPHDATRPTPFSRMGSRMGIMKAIMTTTKDR